MPSRKETPAASPWDEAAVEPVVITPTPTPVLMSVTRQFDLDGLMTDFPTAKDLERFVYDETGQVLNLKGRANKLKYQVAMDVLNGEAVDPLYLGLNNPYIDKADMVPEEPLKAKPDRDPLLPARSQIQNAFTTHAVPHTDSDKRAGGCRVTVTFRKYKNGVISYEVVGPLDKVPVGEKIDKFGRMRPEIIKWIDPRTGEQMVQRTDGTYTPQGKRLRALLQMLRVNKSNQWEVWVDREFVSMDSTALTNPWAIESE